MGICRSGDLRLRVTEAIASGSSRRAAADRFAVSVSSAIRWSARAASEGNPVAPRLDCFAALAKTGRTT